jgi:hypothetical protein
MSTTPAPELAAVERHTYASIAEHMIGTTRDDTGTEYVTLADAEAAVRAVRAAAVSPIPNDQGAIRSLFLKGLAYLRKNKLYDFPEGVVTLNNKFQRFMDSDTDSAWVGFRIAMQYARKMTMTALQPMDTAPKDGTEVILRVKMRAGIPHQYLVGHYMPGGHCIEDHPPIAAGWYFWNGCMFDSASEPEGWLALPHEAMTNTGEQA